MKKGEVGELFMANDGKYVLHAKAKRFPRKTALSLLFRALRNHRASITYFWGSEQAELIHKIKSLYGELEWSTAVSEALQVYTAVQTTHKIEGSLAEVGVFRGGTSKIIGSAKERAKHLHLCDTFDSGLPAPGIHDDASWKKGSFSLNDKQIEEVHKHMEEVPNVHFHKGLFPQETGSGLKSERFSFVNLDVDIYQSTIDCLEFFYPRMNKGAIIMSHDYNRSKGVKKAFDDFFSSHAEPVIPLSTSQCLVVKI